VATAEEPKRSHKDDRRPQHHGKDRREERDRGRERDGAHHRRGGPGERRRGDGQRKTEVHTAAPPRRGGIDPDSPFAALGALREELAKRSKESST
jgi:ATP-dependent RNA helicase SUPV3L1/SUV3